MSHDELFCVIYISTHEIFSKLRNRKALNRSRIQRYLINVEFFSLDGFCVGSRILWLTKASNGNLVCLLLFNAMFTLLCEFFFVNVIL